MNRGKVCAIVNSGLPLAMLCCGMLSCLMAHAVDTVTEPEKCLLHATPYEYAFLEKENLLITVNRGGVYMPMTWRRASVAGTGILFQPGAIWECILENGKCWAGRIRECFFWMQQRVRRHGGGATSNAAISITPYCHPMKVGSC